MRIGRRIDASHRNHIAAATRIVWAIGLGLACAQNGSPAPEPLPSTQEELRVAIAEDRARVMVLLADPSEPETASLDADDEMTRLGERLMRLQEALNELEELEAANPPPSEP